jgi:hypothetical protein
VTKLSQKYLIDYSIDTLRDSEVFNPSEGDLLRYTDGEWKNVLEPAYGKDAVYAVEETPNTNISGGSFTEYLQATLVVPSGTPSVNRYRVCVDFLWGHNSASNDGRFRLDFNNGAKVKELRIEPKDQGTDQRIQNQIKFYVENLSSGSYQISFSARPASANRVTRLYEASIEAWRTL